jgi:4-aminobutyrate aminotransferase / (S)-3-amino-2-methylpropionate transaminase
MIKDFI